MAGEATAVAAAEEPTAAEEPATAEEPAVGAVAEAPVAEAAALAFAAAERRPAAAAKASHNVSQSRRAGRALRGASRPGTLCTRVKIEIPESLEFHEMPSTTCHLPLPALDEQRT